MPTATQPESLIEANQPALQALTARESEVVAHLVQGRSLSEIATEVHRSIETVKTHCRSLMRKLGARNRADVIRIAYQSGIATPWAPPMSGGAALPAHLWPLVAEALLQGPMPLAIFSPRLHVLYQTQAFADLFSGARTSDSLAGILRDSTFTHRDATDRGVDSSPDAESRLVSIQVSGSRTVELTCTPLRDDAGCLSALLVVARDSTELFRLQESHHTLRIALEAHSHGRDREIEALRKTASLEIARRTRFESRHLEVIAAFTAATGTDLFGELSRRLRSALEAHLVVFTHRPASESEPRLLGGWGPNGAPAEEAVVASDALKSALTGGMVHHPAAVMDLYPDDRLVGQERIEAFLGFPIVGGEGMVLGAIGVFDRAPRPEVADVMPMLRLAASRAALELEHRADALVLREARARLRAIDDANPIPMIQLDAGGRCTAVNAAFAAITGRSQGELLGSGWNDCFDSGDARRMTQALAMTTPQRTHPPVGLSIATASGHTLAVRAEIGAAFGPSASLAGSIVAFVRAA